MRLLVELNEVEAGKVFEILRGLEIEKVEVPQQTIPQIETSVMPVQTHVIQETPVQLPVTPIQMPPLEKPSIQTQTTYEPAPPFMPLVNYPLIEQPGQAPIYTPWPQQVAPPVQSVPTQEVPPVITPPVVPTTAATYSPDQLAQAGTQLVDAGRRDELVGLLASFGVQALTQLPKEQYGNFATQLRAMGAKL
jgi:hypothetical protein